MKKFILLLGIIGFLCSSNLVMANEFDNLDGLTQSQKVELSQVYNQFKIDNTKIEASIMEYNNKLAKIKNDAYKTPEQISILAGAYERNIDILKTQQKDLEQKAHAAYKAIMTTEQYQQYQAQQIEVQDAFKKFLQK